MRLDSTLNLVPLTSPLSIVGATGATFASNVIDMLGSGVGTAPANIIGNATLFGQDIGVGGGVAPKLQCTVGTAFVGAATLTVLFQASADTAVTYQPASWTTILQSPGMLAASLTANKIIARFDWPPDFPDNLNPRYLRLLFSTNSGQQFSAGTISFAGLTYVRDDQANKFAANNFVVS